MKILKLAPGGDGTLALRIYSSTLYKYGTLTNWTTRASDGNHIINENVLMMMFELITIIENDYNSVENFHHQFSPILFLTTASPPRDGASNTSPPPPPSPMCQYVSLSLAPPTPQSVTYYLNSLLTYT